MAAVRIHVNKRIPANSIFLFVLLQKVSLEFQYSLTKRNFCCNVSAQNTIIILEHTKIKIVLVKIAEIFPCMLLILESIRLCYVQNNMLSIVFKKLN